MADVVLEQTLSTIVGESLSKLNHGNEESRCREVLAYTAKSSLLVVVGFLAVRGSAILGVRLRSSLGLNLLLNIVRGDVAASKILFAIRLWYSLTKLFMESN